MTDPFKIEGPAAVCFSGGRTSGLMLHRILEAHHGHLPSDVVVCFQNTGVEREETLEFVEEISQRWHVPVVWQEYRRTFDPSHYHPEHSKKHGKNLVSTHADAAPRTVVVDYSTASRRGEPFFQMLTWAMNYRRVTKDADAILPNPAQRICTNELKMKTMKRWMVEAGMSEYLSVMGIRADEPKRLASSRSGQFGEATFPLATAGVVKSDVAKFWKSQPFDLNLDVDSDEGNCTLCFMKKREKIENIMRKTDAHDWFWIQAEELTGQTFRRDRPSYTEMRKNLPVIAAPYEGDVAGDCFCGPGD